MFADLGSSPSSMEAGRIVDAFGMRPGYDIQQSDVVQAYLQAQNQRQTDLDHYSTGSVA